ncbi:MAG: hypothetical protein JO269_03565 [Burkholderiaceae bacterium]|nr:hypothetical protein [Burkholderiaceae bacterium]
MAMELCELNDTLVKINQPLKWDVFSSRGDLLLNKGFVVICPDQLERLLERGMYAHAGDLERSKLGKKIDEYDPFMVWDGLRRIAGRLNQIYLRGSAEEALQALGDVVANIATLIDKHPDAAIFELIQMDVTNYVGAHNLQTAVLATLIAKRLNWDAASTATLCSAAATMNIAILELQTVLAAQRAPLTPAQRAELSNHGARGREKLEQMGVTDSNWLRAVEEHHPEALPAGKDWSEMAGIVHHADIYMAKISPRAYRLGKSPNVAAREMLQGKSLDQKIAGVIIKEIGIYPPGSCVKLANGETAIVTKRGPQAHTPSVYSLVNATGMPLGEPVWRDTTTSSFAISSVVPKSNVMVALNRAKLFEKRYGT